MGFNYKKKIGLVVKLMIFALILACAGPFFLKDENGRPFMTLEKIQVAAYLKYIELKHFLKLDTVEETEKDIITDKNTPPDDREYTEMYKYRDEKGVLHFTDIKPKSGKYEVMYMPVSKDKTVGKKIDGMIDKVFNKDKKKEKSSQNQKNETEGKQLKEQGDIITQAKQMLEKAADQYKEAPEALEQAKEVKQQVEEIYREREKEMKRTN